MKYHRQAMAAAACCLGLLTASVANAAGYSALDLGAADSQFKISLNASGSVTATLPSWSGPALPTIISATGAISTLSVTNSFIDYHAVGINDAGQVVGYTAYGSSPVKGFISDSGSGITPLDLIAANDINNLGQVTGYMDVQSGDNQWSQAVLTGANGVGVIQIAAPQGSSYGVALNDKGQVAGYLTTQEGLEHAFVTGTDGVGVTDLGTLDDGLFSRATDINASGQVVGYSISMEGVFRAFITDAQGGLTDLGSLGQDGTSFASGINASGQVVGFSFARFDDNIPQAFVTGANGVGMTDLNTLVTLPGDVLLQDARAINDAGQIVAFGGDGHLYLLSPVPEPGTQALMLLGLAGVVFVARQRVKATSVV